MLDDIVLARVFDALIRVERIPAEDCGLLSFGSDPKGGGVLVERGRICWAAAPGMQRRLRDLLMTSAADRDIDFDRIYERSRTDGGPFGQRLVDEGCITAHDLETALRRHSAESLVELCRHDTGRTLWTSRGTQGYSPRFAFRPIDVLFDVMRLTASPDEVVARAELAIIEGAHRRGIAFSGNADLDDLSPVAAFGRTSVREVRALGHWAPRLPRATRELATTAEFALVACADGETRAVWWRGSLLYVVICDDRPSLVALISGHLMGRQA